MPARHFLLVVILSGCPRPQAPGPAEVLRAYADAVAAKRIDDAYALMSEEYRRTHDRAAFARALDGGAQLPAELRRARVELSAEVDLAGGEKLPLVHEPAGWRIGRDPLDLYSQRTPALALLSFARAVEARRYDVALKFVPARYRATITVESLKTRWEGERRAELLSQLAAVRQALTRNEPLQLNDDGTARLGVGERKWARLVRENDEWKIESLE